MKNKLNLIRGRIDCVLIWGHGIKYLKEIIFEIEKNKNFEILKIIKYIPKSIDSFIREVYSYDYAPFEHLKAKTKYLKKVDNTVCFIIIKNFNPNEEFYGDGAFRHNESLSLKKLKEKLRDKFNPYEDGLRTHNHIIHATDNQTQTHYLLTYLGFENGLNQFINDKNIFNIPKHINSNFSFSIRNVDISDLICRILIGNNWNDYSSLDVKLNQTPHFMSISDKNIYEDYLMKFIGGPIKDYNSVKKFESMKNDFVYLSGDYYNSYVIVKKYKSKYLVLDGIHRSALHLNQGNKKITVCLIN